MTTKVVSKILSLIFSDADLVDVDLSLWDQVVSIYVIADHVPEPIQGKRALFAVRFFGVRRFDWCFRHHDFNKFSLKTNQSQHLNWNIYHFELVQGKFSELTLGGSEQFPILKIHFEKVNVEPIEHSIFSDVNPDWSTPGSGLGRPGIEALNKMIKNLQL